MILVAGGTGNVGGAVVRARASAGADKLPYKSPQLHIYTDMEDLLALDPPTPGFADIPWKE